MSKTEMRRPKYTYRAKSKGKVLSVPDNFSSGSFKFSKENLMQCWTYKLIELKININIYFKYNASENDTL